MMNNFNRTLYKVKCSECGEITTISDYQDGEGRWILDLEFECFNCGVFTNHRIIEEREGEQ